MKRKLNSRFLTLQKKPMLFFMLQKHPLLRKKEKREKKGRLKRSKSNSIRKQRYIPLYNKPINSPRALKDGLIDENEKESLRDLNEKMRAILGKHYEGHQIVSAQVAFYGLSSALLPETDFYKNKQKFLEIFKEEELLLYKCRFQQLGGFITETLLENSHAKIIESNCNKALKVIEKLQKTISITIDRQIDPTIREIKNHHQEVCDNLDRSKEKYISNLTKSAFTETAIQS